MPVAAGTSVALVAVSALVGGASHLWLSAGSGAFAEVLVILLWTVPGVIIGAQFGVHAARRVQASWMEKFSGILFAGLAILTMAML